MGVSGVGTGVPAIFATLLAPVEGLSTLLECVTLENIAPGWIGWAVGAGVGLATGFMAGRLLGSTSVSGLRVGV